MLVGEFILEQTHTHTHTNWSTIFTDFISRYSCQVTSDDVRQQKKSFYYECVYEWSKVVCQSHLLSQYFFCCYCYCCGNLSFFLAISMLIISIGLFFNCFVANFFVFFLSTSSVQKNSIILVCDVLATTITTTTSISISTTTGK